MLRGWCGGGKAGGVAERKPGEIECSTNKINLMHSYIIYTLHKTNSSEQPIHYEFVTPKYFFACLPHVSPRTEDGSLSLPKDFGGSNKTRLDRRIFSLEGVSTGNFFLTPNLDFFSVPHPRPSRVFHRQMIHFWTFCVFLENQTLQGFPQAARHEVQN